MAASCIPLDVVWRICGWPSDKTLANRPVIHYQHAPAVRLAPAAAEDLSDEDTDCSPRRNSRRLSWAPDEDLVEVREYEKYINPGSMQLDPNPTSLCPALPSFSFLTVDERWEGTDVVEQYV